MNHRARQFARCCACLLILVVSACSHPKFDFSPLPWRTLSIGLCEDYPARTRTIEAARADLQLLATNNIHFLRTAIAWDALEPEPGHYDWTFLDALVNTATAQNIQLLPYICYTPEWAARDTNAFWTQPPKDFNAYANVVKALATRYRGRIHSWEIWNEPDNKEYWVGTVDEYAQLLKLGSRAVREADPEAKVVSGGLAWDLEFLHKLLQDPEVISAIDVVNLHSYYETWSSDGAEDIDRHVNRANRLLIEAGTRKPLWLAELGYSSYRTNGVISYSYHANYKYEHTPEFQGATLFRMLVPVMASTRVSLAAWYRIHDLPTTEEIIGDVNNRHLGIIATNGVPKPAFASFCFFQSLFQDGYSVADTQVRLTSPLSTASDVHAFIRPNGTLVVVAWLKVLNPDQPPAETPLARDSRIEELSLSIPAGFNPSACIYNETGTCLGSTPPNHKHHSTRLQLRGGELRVLIFSPER